MLDTNKLLYILPDVAYVVELLPTKKEHSFTVQSFRQINGEFIDDNEFIAENVEKLVSKLESEEYYLILPDFLFTNTIVEAEETSETKIKEYLTSDLLPSLDLTPQSHHLKTFVLMEHGGKSKIQLSALEKSLIGVVSQKLATQDVKITGVLPLSWTIKSIVSLEPSISIVQLGTRAYLAQHYIGIDQAISSSVDEVVTLAETIKTLKGAEPSIQTVYLVTNNLVESELKDNLSDTLPLQQLASFKEEESEMPSYVKYVIEAGMKSISIGTYPIPIFPLGKQTTESSTSTQEETSPVIEDGEVEKAPDMSDNTPSTDAEADLPKPSVDTTTDTESSDSAETDSPAAAVSAATVSSAATSTTVAAEVTELDINDDSNSEDKPVTSNEQSETSIDSETEQKEEDKDEKPVIESTVIPSAEKETDTKDEKPEVTEQPKVETKPQSTPTLIKNQSGLQPMFKSLAVAFVVFLVTVGVGAGIGSGYMYFSQNQTEEPATSSPSPTVEVTPSPDPSPSPEPSEVDAEEISVLVVNATTKAGHAGKSKKLLDNADFKTVKAGNASGDYTEGTFVLMAEENVALVSLLEETLDLTLEFSEDIETEDPDGEYDAVIVLAE
jgi:hypothetical protein